MTERVDAVQRANDAILARLAGAPSSPATAVTDDDPCNPNSAGRLETPGNQRIPRKGREMKVIQSDGRFFVEADTNDEEEQLAALVAANCNVRIVRAAASATPEPGAMPDPTTVTRE